jgi:hypothetical protein
MQIQESVLFFAEFASILVWASAEKGKSAADERQ